MISRKAQNFRFLRDTADLATEKMSQPLSSLSISRAMPIAIVALVWAHPAAIAEQKAMPQVVFSPAPGVTQAFRVKYRLRYVPEPPGSSSDSLSVDYTLAVTPAREKDGYRLRLLVSEVEHPGGGGMNMVVAAALMLDGLPFDMQVDARGFLTEGRIGPSCSVSFSGAPTPCRPSGEG